MNTRVVGSKTMVVIVTPLLGRKDATCLILTNQYSNEVDNQGMIPVLDRLPFCIFFLLFLIGVSMSG